MARNDGPFGGDRVLPHRVIGALPDQPATMRGEVPLEVAFLHAGISTDSTSAQPGSGMSGHVGMYPPLAGVLIDNVEAKRAHTTYGTAGPIQTRHR
jgi:hypothetical protein